MKKYSIFLLFFILSILNVSAHPTLKVGDKAPDFTVTNTEGNPINLYSLKGKIILLDFWASWCGPCRMANKELIKMYKEYKDNGFEVFSVSLDSDKNAWIKAIEKDKLEWPNHGSDLKDWESAPAQLYGITALPTTFLIDENGIIIAQDYDLKQVQLTLNEYLSDNTSPYPKTTTEKIFLSNKKKFEITDSLNNVILKGKEDIVDVKFLKDGNYILKTEKIIFPFRKVANKNVSISSFKPEKPLEITDSDFYEVYNQRSSLLEKGNGKQLNNFNFKQGIYFVNINGIVNKFVKQ